MKFSCKSIVLPASPSGTCRGRRVFLFTLLAALAPLDILPASELPRLSSELNPKTQTYAAQQKIPYLAEAYLSGSPEDLNDGLPVGTLNLPGAEEAFNNLLRDDKAGKYSNLDSILLWHDGKLVFEMYNRRGRVDGQEARHRAEAQHDSPCEVVIEGACVRGHPEVVESHEPGERAGQPADGDEPDADSPSIAQSRKRELCQPSSRRLHHVNPLRLGDRVCCSRSWVGVASSREQG